MVSDFFRAKRPWSQYKDLILGYYLEPYLAKVKELRRPVRIFDCFAGPGQFEDGKPGSPLIICAAIQNWREKGPWDISGAFIEADDEHFKRLENLLDQYKAFATPKHGTFEQHLPELAQLAQQNTVFLYVDPYSVRSLVFDPMYRVYEQIQKAGTSVEVLLNFNAPIFMRWGLAALKRHGQLGDVEIPVNEDAEEFGVDAPEESVELTTLNGIAGGDYWQAIAADGSLPFLQKLELFTSAYMKLMEGSFKWVRCYGVKSKYQHTIPKYYLIYATRHDDGIALMNDAVCKARREFVKDEFPQDGQLFDTTPAGEVVDIQKLAQELLLAAPAQGTITRRELRLESMKQHFGRYSSQDYSKAVSELITKNGLFSETGKSRINDNVRLSRQMFGQPN
jgi:three-Cys-motif partner protein